MKKLFLTALIIAIFVCALSLSVCAVSYDYSEKATLSDNTVLPIYDENNNPLIWWKSGTDENGKNLYSSVPNNRTAPNENNDPYVKIDLTTGEWAQIVQINIYIYDEASGAYVEYNEKTLKVMVMNLRGISVPYLGKNLNITDVEYIYFFEGLKDISNYFSGKTNLRLIDMSGCENLVYGFASNERNFFNCTNLHTVRLPVGPEYSMVSPVYHNLRFGNSGLIEMVIPANITAIGTDNFSKSTKLVSFYVLGNTTDLGQRNFVGCTSLVNFYFLGDNPQISMQSFYDNFVECFESSGNKTHDLRAIGKYFFFATTDMSYLTDVKDTIGALAVIPYAEYKANPSAYTDGRYVISGTSICDVYYGEHTLDMTSQSSCASPCTVCSQWVALENPQHNIVTQIIFKSYMLDGVKLVCCENNGCNYELSSSFPAIFKCLGYSVSKFGECGLTLGFQVNNKALSDYKVETGNDLKYGLFAAAAGKLLDNDIFDSEGKETNGVVVAEMSTQVNKVFNIKLIGFSTSEHKATPVVLGAYVDNGDSISYIQAENPLNGQKYHSITFDQVD